MENPFVIGNDQPGVGSPFVFTKTEPLGELFAWWVGEVESGKPEIGKMGIDPCGTQTGCRITYFKILEYTCYPMKEFLTGSGRDVSFDYVVFLKIVSFMPRIKQMIWIFGHQKASIVL
jgi:hypothetical protein